jgi:hypothetical protein
MAPPPWSRSSHYSTLDADTWDLWSLGIGGSASGYTGQIVLGSLGPFSKFDELIRDQYLI